MFVAHLTQWLKLPGLARSAEPVWVTPRGVRPDILELERVNPQIGYFLVHDWSSEPHLFEGVEQMFRSVGGEPVVHPVTHGDRTDPVIEALLDERLWLWRVPMLGVLAPAVFPEKPKSRAPPGKPTEVLTWIEVSLVDEEERQPVADEPIHLVEADGRVHSLRTNGDGLVRIDAIQKGVCEVSFPKVDGREWTRLAGSFPVGSDMVDRTHVVQARECIARIAHHFGFRSGATLWSHSCNKPIRDAKRDPNILWPGDRIRILERDARVDDAVAGRRHEYMVKMPTRWLRLVLHDDLRRPLANTPYVLSIPGLPAVSSTTLGNGLLEEPIPPWATEARIVCGDYVWPLAIADLRPLRDAPDHGTEGTLRRLRNLGCPAGRPDAERLRERRAELSSGDQASAIRPAYDADLWMHQVRVGWLDSGELDEATGESVLAEYGV